MPGYLLDTNIVSFWFDEQSSYHPAVQAAAKARRGKHPLYVSAITLGEIEYGRAANPDWVAARGEAFAEFLHTRLPQVIEVSRHTAEPYGRIRASLFGRFGLKGNRTKARRPEQLYNPTTGLELGIDENDLWLVAQAAERNFVLVTHDKLANIRGALQGLDPPVQIEDWAEGQSATAQSPEPRMPESPGD